MSAENDYHNGFVHEMREPIESDYIDQRGVGGGLLDLAPSFPGDEFGSVRVNLLRWDSVLVLIHKDESKLPRVVVARGAHREQYRDDPEDGPRYVRVPRLRGFYYAMSDPEQVGDVDAMRRGLMEYLPKLSAP
jgi:hypothetical protein